MDRKKLEHLLAELRDELTDARGLDEDSRAALRSLAEDVDRLARANQPESGHHASALDKLEDTALRFESQHPQLAEILGRIGDALGRIGI